MRPVLMGRLEKNINMSTENYTGKNPKSKRFKQGNILNSLKFPGF